MSNHLPPEFIRSLQKIGLETEAFLKTHASAENHTSIRLNPFKQADLQPELEQVPWASTGRYLSQRPNFTADPAFHAGAYYVQEASSMFLEQAVNVIKEEVQPLAALDLCAAPGGKSTHLLSLLPENTLVLANEIIKTRVPVLLQNLARWGCANALVSHNDPKDFQRLPHFFDLMLVDAPCSGSGLFRKDPKAISEWSERNVELCSQRQQRILADALPALKPGGYLIYSTCSYSEEENEGNCDWLISTFDLEPVKIPVKAEWNIVETNSRLGAFGYRFYPHKLRGEGFFLSLFKKANMAEQSSIKSKFRFENARLALDPWLEKPGQLALLNVEQEVFALPQPLQEQAALLADKLQLRKIGIRCGRQMGKDFVPDAELALYHQVSKTRMLDLEREEAIRYLKKEELRIQTDLQGWALAAYKGQPLGWLKVLPNRLNNYYPKEWRILSQYIT